jgi:uncharacterized membrane protein YdfJ with MMPL/SSD domain
VDSTNIAARAGRWSADNWKKAFFGWLLVAIVALAVGTAVGHKQVPDSQTAAGEAGKAQSMLEQAGFKEPATESVLIQSGSETTASPRFRAAVQDVVRSLAAADLPNVVNIQSPLVNAGQISRDKHSVLVQFDVRGDMDKAKHSVQPMLDAIARLQKSHPSYRIEEFGMASANHVLDQTLGKDFKKAERLTLPLTLIILLFAFGGACRGGVAGAARLFRGAGLDRLLLVVHEPGAGLVRHHAVGDPADRDGGGRRLLALLPAPRT